MLEYSTKVLVLGGGIAGLSTALKLAGSTEVLLVCKGELGEGASRYAQGGIAAVWSQEDSFERHFEDTLKAGRGLCHSDIVSLCVKEGPERVRELIDLGVSFTRKDQTQFDLHLEGGHQSRRILHADDLTGKAIVDSLVKKVRSHPKIKIFDHHVVVDLITEGKAKGIHGAPGRCLGAYVLDTHQVEVLTISSALTVLATGGAGKVYLYTSNPDSATGDGMAVAHRAGARVANLEFMQFHPTCLFHPGVKTYLISEAIRGEGAVLENFQGKAFVQEYDSRESLAPRDIIARAIDMEMKKTGDPHVWLNASSLGKDLLRKKFPNIYQTCQNIGLLIEKDPIPVIPAAHYMCGGVWTDQNGKTTIQGLYAVGEVAFTGLHGANRLASNSLLEAVVFAHQVAQDILEHFEDSRPLEIPRSLPPWESGMAVELEEKIDIAATWKEVRSLMWNYVGIVRSNRRLERAKRRLAVICQEVEQDYWNYLITQDLVELRNLITVADLMVQSALLRKESRGLHYTVDYPETDEEFFNHDTIL